MGCVQPGIGDGWVIPGYHTPLMFLDTDITSTCIYAWERDFPKEIVVYFILVFSYSKIIKLLGSNKSNYGSDYRVMSIPWILVLYKKRKRIAEAVSFLLLVTHPPTPFC